MRRASVENLSSIDRISLRLNLRRLTRVGAWNAMSLSNCVMNAPVRVTVTYPSYLRNCADWTSVLRPSQKAGDLETGGSLGAVTPTIGLAAQRGILKEWLWPPPTGPYDY